MEKSNLYIILHTDIKDSDSFNVFKENITNNYLSKVVSDRVMIINSKKEKSAYEIYSKLTANISEEEQNSLEIFVTEMEDFYGSLSESVWTWIELQTNEKFEK